MELKKRVLEMISRCNLHQLRIVLAFIEHLTRC